jgi:hypothetical protein
LTITFAGKRNFFARKDTKGCKRTLSRRLQPFF